MESMTSRKYRRLANPAANFDNDNPDDTSLHHSSSNIAASPIVTRFHPEKIGWILVGLFALYWSRFYVHVVPTQWPAKAWWPFIALGHGCFLLFVSLFVYLNYYLRFRHGILITARHWKRDAPVAVPAATVSGSVAFLFWFVAFLPVYHAWSLLLFPILFLSFFAFISLF